MRTIKLSGLEVLYKDMRDKGKDYVIFDYSHSAKIKLIILFDIKTIPFSLLLIKKVYKQTLLLDIQRGFMLDTFLQSNQYNRLLQMLEIKPGIIKSFSTKEFFQELNSKIPTHTHNYILDDETRMAISHSKNFEEKDKILICGYIDWDEIKNGKTYTQANREKTRILYPDVYKKIKDKNISIKYTANKKDEIIF